MRKKYKINKWSDWLNELWDSVIDFTKTYINTPNIVELNEHTRSQFEYMMSVSPIGQEIESEDEKIKANEYSDPKLSHLTVAQNCTLKFKSKQVDDKIYVLSFDKYIENGKNAYLENDEILKIKQH